MTACAFQRHRRESQPDLEERFGLSGLHELDLDGDGDLVTNENSTGLEGSIPRQAEVLTADLCARRDRNPGVAPWVLGRWSWPFHRKPGLTGDAVDAQVAHALDTIAASEQCP